MLPVAWGMRDTTGSVTALHDLQHSSSTAHCRKVALRPRSLQHLSLGRLPPLHIRGDVERQNDLPETYQITLGEQPLLRQLLTVHEGSVPASDILDHESFRRTDDAGMLCGHTGVAESDRVRRGSADRRDLLEDRMHDSVVGSESGHGGNFDSTHRRMTAHDEIHFRHR